jgi:tRNA (cmo5U34)-methyltransferase
MSEVAKLEDKLAGDGIATKNAGWTFAGEVAEKFDEHVSKSVPFYNAGHDLVCRVSDFFLHRGSRCYELGCSTAALTAKLAAHNASKEAEFVGIEIEPDMVKMAQKRCAGMPNVQIQQADLRDVELDSCDMIASYYTIQFVPPKHRQQLYDKIYNALNWGGAFLLFEKVRAPDARFQDITTALYNDYKVEQGYTPDEIFSKYVSLKGVLEPFSTQGNLDLLKRAGFVDVVSIFKYVCFEGFLAIK